MRISLNWLQDYVQTSLPPDKLADALTMAGFEVEEIEDRRTWAEGVVVGQVLACTPHPDADKLSVCQVDIGAASPSTIVCGAANVRAGIKVPVATVGSYLPIVDITIKGRKLRGVPSEGMICSLAELGLAKESAGIHIFTDDDLQVGQDVRPLLGLDDIILDLTSTANRADALSMVGIAREVAAIAGERLNLPEIKGISAAEDSSRLSIQLTDSIACPIYIGTVLETVTIGPSPRWLQQRLQAAGTRPINNVVDITNYVLLEWGQPLHAFDYERLLTVTGADCPQIGVRFARSDEALQTLDGQMRSLDSKTLLITANDQPVALAGVMGGEEAEVQDGTTTVMLEAAYFDSATIRRSARSQGLRTEASARYERGVNPAELELACQRALQLIQELAGGQIATQVVGRTPSGHIDMTRTIDLRIDRVHQVLGPVRLPEETSHIQVPLPPEAIQRTLAALGCQVLPGSGQDKWQVQIPPYRYRDLEREIDLIEEIARLYGYNNFCDTLPTKTERGFLSPEMVLARRIRAAFRAAGLTEVLHYSLTKPGEPQQVVLANPLFTEYSALRSDLVGGLIEAFQFNLEQGNGPLNAFEMGHIFGMEQAQVRENEAVAGILGGDPQQGTWIHGGQEQPLSWYEAKGMLEQVFNTLGLVVEYRPENTEPRLHPGRTASLWVRGNLRLGYFGQLHPQLRRERGLPDAVFIFQLDWPLIVNCLRKQVETAARFRPYSTYPASDRDIAFFASSEIAVADITRLMTKTGGNLLESVTLFDEYRGEHVPAGQRSLAFRLVYRSSDRTLTDADIEPVHQKIREALETSFQVSLRS